jgi:hypothetical protein
VLIFEAGPAYIDVIMDEYEKQLEGLVQLDDPTAPENLKEQFKEKLEITLKFDTRWEGDKLHLQIVNFEDLGYDNPPESWEEDLLRTFVFILEGIAGEYAWIGEDFYIEREREFPKMGTRVPGQRYGRAGMGYLIERERFFREGWDKFGSFDTFRWGFSGQGPKDIFDAAQKRFDWEPYYDKAIDMAISDLKRRGF